MSFPKQANQHESPIKTPRQLLITVILAFLIPIFVIILLVNMVGSTIRTGAGSDALTEEAIAKRIQPVASFKLVDADAPKVFQTGEQVYESTCLACHGTGVANAPKFKDEGDWAPYIKQGYESLVKNAIDGIGAMPPRGGNSALADIEVARAVVYMANHSGADFDEPAENGDAESAEPAKAADAGNAAETTEEPAAEQKSAPSQEEAAPSDKEADGDQQADASKGDADQGDTDQAAAATTGTNAAELEVGEKLYKTVCLTCHDSGVAGAPKYGDKEAWAPYIKTGMDAMLKNAISGVGAMPPRGGSQATDEELKAAIEYILRSVE